MGKTADALIVLEELAVSPVNPANTVAMRNSPFALNLSNRERQ